MPSPLTIKRFLPKSIIGRFLLIIIIPTILAQLFAIYMFYERHWENVSRHLQTTLAGELALMLDFIHELPAHEPIPMDQLNSRMLHVTLTFHDLQTLPKQQSHWLDTYPLLSSLLTQTIETPYQLRENSSNELIFIDFELPDGVLTANINKKRLATPTTYIYIMWMTGTAFLLLIISVAFMRNQLRPIIRLADAADKFGKGKPSDDFKPEGATEARKAAEAFLDMKERIDRQVSQRTTMLAGVSHDLRTPLTRMTLQLALMKSSDEIKALQNDIHEMETMINGYLDFAKGNEHVSSETVNITEQLKQMAAHYRKQHDTLSLDLEEDVIIHINLNNFKRIVSNLIENAMRHAHHIHISLTSTRAHITLTIDDDGPGIDVEEYDNVFKPFYRIEHSRNKTTGGTGLGLSITRDLIMRYGGDISLDKSHLGGLRITVSLPI